jgi:hypothetical protein
MAQDRIILYPTTLTQMSCRLQYHWGRNYRAPASDSLKFGIVIHEALQRYYEDGQEIIDALDEYVADDPEGIIDEDFNYALAAKMLSNYRERYKREQFKVLAAELEIARKLPTPHDEPDPPERAANFYVGARVDLIVLDKALGKTFVMDHKTFDRFYPDSIQRDHQFVVETYVAEGWLNEPVAGFLYNGLRKKAEPGPTTNLFERVPVYVNDQMKQVMLHRAYWKLKEATAEYFPIYPEPSSLVCAFCRFKSPCTEYMRGGDYKFLLDNTMERRERGEDGTEWVEETYDG